ncbi:hypothetical protein ACJJTC_007104 [Scirpophaga incertulas]
MDESWEITVKAARGVAGGATLLTCVTSPAARAHVSVTRWFKDGVVLTPIAVEAVRNALAVKEDALNDIETAERLPSPPRAQVSVPTTKNQLMLREFILYLESLPELWDTSSSSYKNNIKREEALGKLLDIYKKIKTDATIEDVKKKNNTLRSNYRKELKKIVVSKRSGSSCCLSAKIVGVPRVAVFKQNVLFCLKTASFSGAVRLKTSGTNRLPMTARLSLRLLIRRLDSGNSINHPPPPAESQPILMTI